MKYGNVPGVAKNVSRLVQGTMVLSSEDLEASFALLDDVSAQGCTTFDSAHIYGGGDCERVLGLWMEARGNREEIVVLSKGAHFNADRNRVTPFDITSDLFDSLARLKTGYIDLYLLHRDDPSAPVGPIIETLNEHHAAGRIHAFGGSNWSHERIAEACAYADAHGMKGFVASSPQFSMVDQVEPPWPGCVSIGGPGNAPVRAWYAERNMAVFSWSSLARGFLSGQLSPAEILTAPEDTDDLRIRCFRSQANLERLGRAAVLAEKKGFTIPQVALAYLFHQPLNLFTLVGCETGAQFQANAQALDLPLSDDEVRWLYTGEA